MSIGRQTPSGKTVFRTVAVLPFSSDTVDIFSGFQAEGVISVRTVDIADILNAAALFKTFYHHGIGLCVKLQRSFCRQGNAYFGQIDFCPDSGSASICIYHLSASVRYRHRPIAAAKRGEKTVIFDFCVRFYLDAKGRDVGFGTERVLTEHRAVRNTSVSSFICQSVSVHGDL